MAYPVWQPGTLYQPGDIVVPITAPSPTATAVENGDFSAGASNWDFTGAAFYSTHVSKGGWKTAVELPGNQPSGGALNQTKLVVPVGKKITATCLIDQGASIAGATRGWVEVHWFSGTDVLLRVDKGNQVDDGRKAAVHPSTCESVAPNGAAYCRAGISLWSVADHSHSIWGGALQVQGTFAGLPADLAYKAVQPESGFSDSNEPAWPPILGQRVDDNEVTWEAISATRVTWTAEPLYVSGDIEPDWPEDEGGMVKDGTVTFRAVSRRVEDPNCPNTKIVAIAASKVFCGDDDIVRYSATVNPLDWSTDNDAGYLPTGLQNYGANPVEAIGLYRGNLIVFNAEAFQLWQVDEDPANMALLDALPMGSTQHHAIAPVSNDLFFLSSQGVRTVGIAASSTNFQAGDVGMPIDPLVRTAMTPDANPMSLYYPAMGQYWLMFQPVPEPPPARIRLTFYSSDGHLYLSNIDGGPAWLATPSDGDEIDIQFSDDGGSTKRYSAQVQASRWGNNAEPSRYSGESGTGKIYGPNGEEVLITWEVKPALLNVIGAPSFAMPFNALIPGQGAGGFVDNDGAASDLLAMAGEMKWLSYMNSPEVWDWESAATGDHIPDHVPSLTTSLYGYGYVYGVKAEAEQWTWEVPTSVIGGRPWAGVSEFLLDGQGPFYVAVPAFVRLLDHALTSPGSLWLGSNGQLHASGVATTTGEWWSTTTPAHDAVGIGNNYECRLTVLAGSISGGNIIAGTWQSLAVNRTTTIGSGASVLLEVRDAATATVQDTCTITWS